MNFNQQKGKLKQLKRQKSAQNGPKSETKGKSHKK
jgi:hypothetical protein